uniref:TOG domain-containing protein n=1 Tax=Arcella intermedia TaxID=1963864 RepID=A0A6B2L0P7_9EUKA|eukprot:TRINITY_DN18733_c0_g2_i2.p2 TRINITY_DN18733_c0_g2~~TRINITY_DN18733_c0_g2_i2.p2  ORF type:complete len:567 (+),score=123.17 TRINITY_DN18733_c0_g2_i2:100-1800(+)
MQRIRDYGASEQMEHRLYVMREMVTLAEAIGFSDSCICLIETIEQLIYDKEVTVKLKLAENFTQLALYLFKVGGSDNRQMIFSKIIPIFSELLLDRDSQVREVATASFLNLAENLDGPAIIQGIVPFLDKLYNEGEDNKVLSITLLNKIAKNLGKEYTISDILPTLQNKILLDTLYRVRVAMVNSMPSLFEVIGIEETTNTLFSIYQELAKDEIWSVRKACADILGALAKSITLSKCTEELVPIFEAFATDNSRWVRTAAYSSLGLIISIAKPLKPSLVDTFCKLAIDTPQTEYCDIEHPRICAYSFPAVLDTLGPDGWKQLEETYILLACSAQKEVRKTIACSLHVVANISGEAKTEQLLLPIFESYLNDFEEIKKETLKNFVNFLKKIQMEKRKNFLWVLEEVQHSDVDWRLRKIIGQQIGELSLLFDSNTTYNEITPYFFGLVQDPVAKIRKITLSQAGKIVESLSSSTQKRNDFLKRVIELGISPSYQHRIIFSKICGKIAHSVEPEIFKQQLLPPLLKLAQDNVINCQIITRETLNELVSLAPYKTNPLISSALNKRQPDK